jgi:hypothetical protein
MKISRLGSSALGLLLAAGMLGQTQTAAKADTASTAAIVAGAAAIVGALVYDGNNRPYYVRNDRRYYVSQSEASYYRGHHHGVMRNAYVPEQEYAIQRDPYHGGGNNGHGSGGNHQGQNHH